MKNLSLILLILTISCVLHKQTKSLFCIQSTVFKSSTIVKTLEKQKVAAVRRATWSNSIELNMIFVF
jgi:hypothetical protein